MKKLTLLLALGLSLITTSAFAYDYRHDNRTAYVTPGRNGLEGRLERLKRWGGNPKRGRYLSRRDIWVEGAHAV